MTIDDLAKGNWPDLDTIVMSNFVDSQGKNYIWDSSCLTKSAFSRIKYISIEFASTEEEHCYDITWIIKMPSYNF